ncbi:MAG TPA: hypothetical protein VK302_08985 [Terriglobales bacterium]|nr:hypothetical protein [Terriglobales bacterium]
MSDTSNQQPVSAIQAELDAMRAVGEAFENLDPETRARVMSWAASRFGIQRSETSRKDPAQKAGRDESEAATEGELPGIARLTENGNLEVTVRDLKAKSTLDAAVRLAHMVIYANEKLKGERSTSSRKVLVPILKEWRAYDGNTRNTLRGHKGIHRDGDALSLDAIAKKDAERYIAEVLDGAVVGTWNPNGRASRKAPAKKNTTKQGAD